MKNCKLKLKENETLVTDFDDKMVDELKVFKNVIKGLTKKHVIKFNNWVKIYKLLNYDIIGGLKVIDIYKFNNTASVVELEFRGNREYDFLNFNPEDMTVACMSVKNNQARNYISRRLLIPDTEEEALIFAKSKLEKESITVLIEVINQIKKYGKKYSVLNEVKPNEYFDLTDEEKECKNNKNDNLFLQVKMMLEISGGNSIVKRNEYRIQNNKQHAIKEQKPVVKQQIKQEQRLSWFSLTSDGNDPNYMSEIHKRLRQSIY